ncbi:MAG: hypothetical protein M1839_003327 [Geoglossum umbratile]|nr:MAG: hypothetical protein M1839_003327 [Geoglossum umbratile]
MFSTNVQSTKATGSTGPLIHAPVPIKQFGSNFLSEFMAVQRENCVYTINTLLHLGKSLPKLYCNINKFNAYAFEGEILRYRGKAASPSSFPAVGYRPFADIPSYELSRRDAAGLEKLWHGVKGNSQSEFRLRNPRDTKSDGGKTDFGSWVGRVTSPSNNRVTAGGRVVPVIPPPPRPAFANLVTPGSIAFGPPLHDNARQTIAPPRPYVPVPTGWEIVWIEDKAYLAPQQVGIPAPHPYPVSSLAQPQLSNNGYGLQQPLMNVTNAVMPQAQQAVIQQQQVGQQQPTAASQLQAEHGVWNDYLRAAYFEEQSRQARLRRVNGLAPKAIEPEATRENIKKWNGVLASDGKEFVSASRRVMNYGSPSTKVTRDRVEPSSVNSTTVLESSQPVGGGQHETTGVSRVAADPIALAHTAGEGVKIREAVGHSGRAVAASGSDTSRETNVMTEKGKDGPRGGDKNIPVHNAANSEGGTVIPETLAEKNPGANGKVNVNNVEAKKALPISERGKAAREAIAIFLQEQLKGRSVGANRQVHDGMGKFGKDTIASNDNEGAGNGNDFLYPTQVEKLTWFSKTI